MKIDQIAYYCETPNTAAYVKDLLGLTFANWITDTVTARSSVYGRNFTKNVAQLQFNYDLGIELEILKYIEGPHWHERTVMKDPLISHVGIHLDDHEDFPDIAGRGKGTCQLVQETFTEKHTSEYLTTGAGTGRLYHYKIFQMQKGNFVKYIKRIRNNERGYQAAREAAE